MTAAPERNVQAYLFFDGRCEEALGFYKKALGAEIGMMMRVSESPEGGGPGVPGDKILHASFFVGRTLIMASDGWAKGQPKFEGFCLSINTKDEAETRSLFNALRDGGEVTQPLMQTFFSPAFGMVKDKFGVHWMVLVPQDQ
ncbi:MAG TPA: VOC family protein [Xanthobacteraceae bacterium]|nr:VOC family protein [Xanthobacteraceae bacterium]